MMSDIRTKYAMLREKYLEKISSKLEFFVKDLLQNEPRIDRIDSRAKSIDKFVEKANKKKGEIDIYDDPLSQIQDQIGVRIIVFYSSDVDRISERVKSYFRPIEEQRIIPESDYEFGYFGQHFILLLPSDVMNDEGDEDLVNFFELQIKTLYQHAWSEANHDLGYKPNGEIDSDDKRKLAFTAAQSWGADKIFNELFLQLDN